MVKLTEKEVAQAALTGLIAHRGTDDSKGNSALWVVEKAQEFAQDWAKSKGMRK